MITITAEEYMKLALNEAVKGEGAVNPNPMVGAIVVKDGRIIARGYHHHYGGFHAERMALTQCEEDPAGATLYVTLEPCCHTGKTPPCTDIIVESGIRGVVIASLDPNPKVDGGGVRVLRDAGVKVETGILGEACDAFYAPFFHYITTKTPWVLMKYAMTADGKIATRTGASRWVTGEVARKDVHHLRNRMAGIMVGIGTVLADDPMLNCRLPGGHDPLRIICDTHLRIPLDAKVVKSAQDIPTVIATASDVALAKTALKERGCRIITLPKAFGGIDLRALMKILGAEGIDSILLEGGAVLNENALRAGIVSALRTYMAPKLFGGAMAKTPVGGLGVAMPDEAWPLTFKKMTVLGDDLVMDWGVTAKCLPEL